MIFSKRKIFYTDGLIDREIRIFGFPIFRYSREASFWKTLKTVRIARPNLPKSKDQPVFYLKVNRVHRTAFDCLQGWMDIADKMGAFCYIICDNPIFERGMSTQPVYFYRNSFAIIKTEWASTRPLIKGFLRGGAKGTWSRIAGPMLTPFIHASKNGYENAFNIDADDIMIFADPKKVAEALKEASSYAKDNEVDCLNLDMLVSKTFGVHWSFGVVFMNHPKTCLDKIAQNFNWWSDFKRQKEYKVSYVKRYNFNVDWLFTFLRDTKQLSLKTFAIKNALVIHMPDIVITPTWTFAFQWREDSLYFPVYDLLYKNHKLANIPISPKVLLLDVGLGSDSYVDFANTFYWWGFDFENDMLDVALERGDIDQLKHDEHFIFSNPRSRY